MQGLKFSKGRPKRLDKQDVARAIATTDRQENVKVHRRSGGICELIELVPNKRGLLLQWRCAHRAAHVHHLISGIGRRNRGVSLLAAHKLHLCRSCHTEVHAHVLTPVNAIERESASTVRYERQR